MLLDAFVHFQFYDNGSVGEKKLIPFCYHKIRTALDLLSCLLNTKPT